MPGYKTHLVGGLAAYGITIYVVTKIGLQSSWLMWFEWFLFTLSGSLFPDIDTKSKGQKLFYMLLFVIFAILVWRGQLHKVGYLSFLALIPIIVPHRGLFHRMWFIIAFALGIAGWCAVSFAVPCRIFLLDALFFIVGAISHLWLDLGCRRMLGIKKNN